MGANFFSIEIEKTQPGAKFSAAYDLPWWFLQNTLKNFAQNTESPVMNYLSEFASKEGQTNYLKGKRPYTRQSFTYNFPDCTGLCLHAAFLTEHWLKLALTIWRSELDGYFGRCGIRICSQLPIIKEIVANEQFVFLRNATWSVSTENNGEINLFGQGIEGAEKITFDALNADEQKIVNNVLCSGLCSCEVCGAITPNSVGVYRLKEILSQPQDFYGVQRVGLWIASLVSPQPEVIRMLLDAVPRLTTDSSATYAGQFRPAKAFYLLCRRVPEVFATLREGLSSENDWTRAVVISGMKAQLTTDQVSYADYMKVID